MCNLSTESLKANSATEICSHINFVALAALRLTPYIHVSFKEFPLIYFSYINLRNIESVVGPEKCNVISTILSKLNDLIGLPQCPFRPHQIAMSRP